MKWRCEGLRKITEVERLFWVDADNIIEASKKAAEQIDFVYKVELDESKWLKS